MVGAIPCGRPLPPTGSPFALARIRPHRDVVALSPFHALQINESIYIIGHTTVYPRETQSRYSTFTSLRTIPSSSPKSGGALYNLVGVSER
jgi:hypothetical protein